MSSVLSSCLICFQIAISRKTRVSVKSRIQQSPCRHVLDLLTMEASSVPSPVGFPMVWIFATACVMSLILRRGTTRYWPAAEAAAGS